MKIIEPAFEIIDEINGEELLKKIEKAGRVCYKSEGKITKDSAGKFIQNIIKSGHESVIEHEKVTVKIICDRVTVRKAHGIAIMQMKDLVRN